jgi:hypothetical protein
MMVEGGDAGGEDWMQRREIHQLQVQNDKVKMEKKCSFSNFCKKSISIVAKMGGEW